MARYSIRCVACGVEQEVSVEVAPDPSTTTGAVDEVVRAHPDWTVDEVYDHLKGAGHKLQTVSTQYNKAHARLEGRNEGEGRRARRLVVKAK